MHISEGVIDAAPVLIAGWGLAAAGAGIGLAKMDADDVPRAAILSSAFFVATLVHVPVGPVSAHLILNGLLGLLLGWAAFPAILVALALQALFFGYGGPSILGVNTVLMATPAVLAHYLFRPFLHGGPRVCSSAAFGAGAAGVLGAAVFMALAMVFAREEFLQTAKVVVWIHLPVMAVEGVITAMCVAFLRKVQPDLLPGFAPGKGGEHDTGSGQ
ncbi:MAG: cobalt transporter CbiM [Desulfatibacillaceae bacterium]